MNRKDSGIVVVIIGLMGLLIGLTSLLTRYLRPGMGGWLVLAGAVCVGLGAMIITGDKDSGHAVRHRGSRVGWLLLLPVFVAVVVDPGALGSYSIAGQVAYRSPVLADFDFAEYLRSRSFAGQAVDLSLLQLAEAVETGDHVDLLAATPLSLQGFIVHDSELENGFLLARFVVGCCAADATPVMVVVMGDDLSGVPDDTWVKAEVTFDPAATAGADQRSPWRVPVVSLVEVEPMGTPREPYLYPF